MVERRKLRRARLAFNIKVTEANSGLYLGNIVDMNVCGFATVGETRTDTGRDYELQIHLPKPISGRHYFSCRAVVRRCDQIMGEHTREIGFEISGIELMDRRILEHIVAEYEERVMKSA